MRLSWFTGETIEVPCTVEIEQTPESLHAYAEPLGIAVRCGDTVTIHGAPDHVAFGARVILQCRATVVRARAAERLWTRLTAMLELTDLYEVGFSPGEGS